MRRLIGVTTMTLLASACVVSKDTTKQDTTVAAADTAAASRMVQGDSMATDSMRADSAHADSTASTALADSTRAPGAASDTTAHATSDSIAKGAVASLAATTADTGAIRQFPTAAQRGGVVVVIAQDRITGPVSCTWKGASLPCYATPANDGVRAIVPLPASEPAGTFTLVMRGLAHPVSRQITVADRDFGRGLVFLDPAHYALVTQRAEIARDARATKQILAGESPQQRWSGAWRDPASGAKSSPYGIERFYYRASDSTRSITLSPAMKTSFGFGEDTSTVAPKGTIGWRHTGVDIPLSRGAPVRASAAGVVTDVGKYILTGNTVIVDHGQGVHTAYFHLDTVTVRTGESVKTGSVLGRVGATGLTTGPHLHYGVYVHGKDVDPVLWHKLPRAALDVSSTATRK